MTEVLEGQMSLSDLGIWSGKMCKEHSDLDHQSTRTSELSSRKQRKSQNQMPQFLDLRKDGQNQELSWDQTGAQLGSFMTHSGGEFLKEENGFVWFSISMGLPPQKYYLVLNCSERPNEEIHSKLSDILDDNPDDKYILSAKACEGMMQRASRRGKDLPEVLLKALEDQINNEKSGICDAEN